MTKEEYSEITIKKLALSNAMEHGGMPVNNSEVELNEWMERIIHRATEIEKRIRPFFSPK
jgi:hypothetical protein